jgi:gamma-glutamylputrescine oxidase
VHIHEDTEVMAIKKNKDDFEMTTSRGALIASQIIVTTNAYLPLLNPEFRNLIVPGRGQILLTKPLPQFVKGPCYLTKHLCYFRQLPTGELLIGGFRNLAVDAEKTHTDKITPVIQDALFDFVKSHFRYGAKAQIFKQWAGIMGYSPDGQMLIGARTADPHIHYMAGCSGHGMGLSFKAAQTLADSVFKRSIPAHLDIKRFNI